MEGGVLLRDAAHAITQVLAPFLGETMARVSVEAHRTKLGLPSGELDDAQVAALVRNVGLGLNVFVGRQTSAKVVVRIEKALDLVRTGRTER